LVKHTSFSAFSFEAFALIQQRSFLLALAYTVGSVVLGQLAVVVGMILARLFWGAW
jgi:fluoride ion exporter CrcB/FEX